MKPAEITRFLVIGSSRSRRPRRVVPHAPSSPGTLQDARALDHPERRPGAGDVALVGLIVGLT